MGLFTSKWKNKKSEKREQWIAKADENNPRHLTILAELAKSDEDRAVRSKAANKITHQDTLADIAQHAKAAEIRLLTAERIDDENILVIIVQKDKDWNIRQKIIQRIKNIDVLTKVALEDKSANVRQAAVKNLTDEKTLAIILHSETDRGVLQTALKKVNNNALLTEIIKKSEVFEIRQLAWDKLGKADSEEALLDIINYSKTSNDQKIKTLKRLNNKKMVADIAQKTKDKAVALAALNRIGERDLIERVSKNAVNRAVRQLAKTRLRMADIKAGKLTKPVKLTAEPGKMLELKHAILKNDYNKLFLLLDGGVDVNAIVPEDPSDMLCGDRETLVIQHAISAVKDKGDNTVLQILIAYGLDLNVPMWDSQGTALFSINSTVRYTHSEQEAQKAIDVARFLVKNGLDINRVNAYRTTPLLDIVQDMRDYGKLLCQFYIGNGANPFIKNTKGETPVSLEPELFKSIENNFDISTFNRQFEGFNLFETVEYAFPEPLQIWLDANKGSNIKKLVHSVDKNGATALYRAMNSGNYEGCKLLINNGADINKENAPNYNFKAPFTLLHNLAFSVQDDRSGLKEGLSFIEYLIDQGAELDKTTEFNPDIFPDGATALNIASCMNSWKVCRLLVKKGASQNGLIGHLHNVINTYNNPDAQKLLDFALCHILN